MQKIEKRQENIDLAMFSGYWKSFVEWVTFSYLLSHPDNQRRENGAVFVYMHYMSDPDHVHGFIGAQFAC